MEQGSFKRLKAQDGKEYTFNALAFKKELKRTAVAAKQKGIVSSIEAFKEGLADKIAVTKVPDAVLTLQKSLNPIGDITTLPFSSERKIYKDDVWNIIDEFI